MSWAATFLDTAAAPSADVCDQAAQQAGASGHNWYIGGPFSGGSGWTPDLARELVRRGYGGLATYVGLRPGMGSAAIGAAQGHEAAALAGVYPTRIVAYDIEPSSFAADPTGVAAACDAWCDVVKAAGLLAVIYGTPATVAACANHADLIWIANPNPGGADPASQPLDPAFFAGRRAVQFGFAGYAGVGWDVNHSEFSLGGDMLEQTDKDWITQTLGVGQGQPNFAATVAALLGTEQQNFNQLNAALSDLTADGGKLDQIIATLGSLQVPPANLQPVLDAVAAVRADLGSLTLKRA